MKVARVSGHPSGTVGQKTTTDTNIERTEGSLLTTKPRRGAGRPRWWKHTAGKLHARGLYRLCRFVRVDRPNANDAERHPCRSASCNPESGFADIEGRVTERRCPQNRDELMTAGDYHLPLAKAKAKAAKRGLGRFIYLIGAGLASAGAVQNLRRSHCVYHGGFSALRLISRDGVTAVASKRVETASHVQF